MDQHRIQQKGFGGYSLHSEFTRSAGSGGPSPYDAKLRPLVADTDVQQFPGTNSPPNALQHQAAGAHVDNYSRVGEGLAVRVKPPDLYRQLHFHAWALATIHGSSPMLRAFTIVREERASGNLPELSPRGYWSAEAKCLVFSDLGPRELRSI